MGQTTRRQHRFSLCRPHTHHHPSLFSTSSSHNRQSPGIAVEDLGCSTGGLSARQQADIEELVLDQLRKVVDSVSLKDVVTLGCVQRLTVDRPEPLPHVDESQSSYARVTFKLAMPRHLQGHTEQYAELKKQIFAVLNESPDLRAFNVRVLAEKESPTAPAPTPPSDASPLVGDSSHPQDPQVGHLVLVLLRV
jgi:hypothetical protein